MSSVDRVFSNVAIIDGREARWFIAGVAEKLKEKFGSKIFVFCRSKDSANFYQNLGYVDVIVQQDILFDTMLTQPPPSDILFAQASAVEAKLGQPFNRARMMRRDTGLGFFIGGSRHPKSYFSEIPSWENYVHGMTKTFEFWFEQMEKYQVTLLLNPLKEEAMVARSLKIPVRALYPARIDNNFFWAVNEMIDYPFVSAAVERTPPQSIERIHDVEQYYADQVWRKKLLSGNKFFKLMTSIYNLTRNHIIKTIFQREDRKSYYLWQNIKYLIRAYIEGNRLCFPNLPRLADVKNKKYVFYALQTEPEASLHMISQECFVQIDVIARLARDLPIDTVLVVKETIYGFGRRPKEFYEQIRRLKNTILVDTYERGVDLIRQSAAVATISGTVGLEAALLGKPVLLFGRHNFYDPIDHVFKIFRDEDLWPALQKALSNDFDHQKAQMDGVRLREAIKSVTFSAGSYTNASPQKIENSAVEAATDSLLATFDGRYEVDAKETRVS